MIEAIDTYCDGLKTKFNIILPERKQLLETISNYIRTKRSEVNPANLVFICPHNSRRSHFAQIWARVARDYFRIPGVETYSAGTEVSSFNEHAINALKRVGFMVRKVAHGTNPIYEVYHDLHSNPRTCFSKVYDHVANPSREFAAIMTCSEAERNCPFIPGAEFRIGTTYDAPKTFDNTQQQDARYDTSCQLIAMEMFYVVHQLVATHE